MLIHDPVIQLTVYCEFIMRMLSLFLKLLNSELHIVGSLKSDYQIHYIDCL